MQTVLALEVVRLALSTETFDNNLYFISLTNT